VKYLYIFIAFIAGAVAASFIWGESLQKCQLEIVAIDLGRLEEEALVSEHIFRYLDNPNPTEREFLSTISSNALTLFPSNVDAWDQKFPRFKIKLRYESKSERLQTYWIERESRTMTNSSPGDQK
jgi:hypothetical protein